MRQLLAAVLATALSLGTVGCTQVRNPATGELQYTSLSPADEKKARISHRTLCTGFFAVTTRRALTTTTVASR